MGLRSAEPTSAPPAPQVRVCYANLSLEKTREAAARLQAGLTELVAGGVDLKLVGGG